MYINSRKIILRKATAANVVGDIAATSIATNEFTQGIGFGSLLFDVTISFLADAGAGSGVVIETSSTRAFTVITTPTLRADPPFHGGTISAAGFLSGQQIIARNLEGSGWWRVKNTMAGAIQVAYIIKSVR